MLLPPLTGLEALDHTVEGGVLVIQSRLSLNMAAHTLEQVLSRRRKMLMDMCTGIELELRDQLDDRLGPLGIRMLNLALQFGPFAKPTEWFNDDENFAQVMSSTLRLQHVLQNEVAKLAQHLEKPELSFRGWRESANSRMWLIAGWVNGRTSQNEVAVDLRESRVTDAEGMILAEVLQRCPRLTSLDLRGNPELGEAGLSALCQALRNERPGHPRSLCGVSPLNTRLDVPRVFAPGQHVDCRLIVAELENHIYSESVTAGMGGKATGGCIQLNRRGGGGGKEGSSGWLPLMWAARACHVQIAAQLIRNGAKVNEQEAAGSHSQKYSPLHMACYKGHLEMTRLLLRSGADLTLKDVNGQVAKTVAEKKGHKEVVELLEQHASHPLPPLDLSAVGGGGDGDGGLASPLLTPTAPSEPTASVGERRRPIVGGGGTPRSAPRHEGRKGGSLTPESTPRKGPLPVDAAPHAGIEAGHDPSKRRQSLMPRGAAGVAQLAANANGAEAVPRASSRDASPYQVTPRSTSSAPKLATDVVKPVPQPMRTP